MVCDKKTFATFFRSAIYKDFNFLSNSGLPFLRFENICTECVFYKFYNLFYLS